MLAHVKPELCELCLALIDEPVLPARATMDETRMDELVASMRAHGFISTLAVVRVGDRYEVITGHRRRIAAARAGLVAVPCLVYPSKDVALEAIKFAENRHREDLKPDEEAIWFDELLNGSCGGDTDRLAALLGETRDYVEGRLALLYGDEEVFRALGAGVIGIGIAQQLNRCTDERHRRYLLHQAVTCGATVGIVGGWIHEWRVLHMHVSPSDGTAPPAAVAGPPVLDDYFTCYVCRSTEHPGNMRPVQVHNYCIPATLDPALAAYLDRHAYTRRPRTHDEAVELINDLIERFPSLAATTTEPSAGGR